MGGMRFELPGMSEKRIMNCELEKGYLFTVENAESAEMTKKESFIVSVDYLILQRGD